MDKFDAQRIGDAIEGMHAGEDWARSRATWGELERLASYECACVQDALEIDARPYGAPGVAQYLVALADPKKGARGVGEDDILAMYGRAAPSMDYLLGFVECAIDAHRQAANWLRDSLDGPGAEAS